MSDEQKINDILPEIDSINEVIDSVDLQAQLENALAEVASLKEQVLRAKAETENIRRRTQEDISKAHKFGIESFAESLVPVRDSLEAALKDENQSIEAMRQGIDAIHKQLSNAFERHRLLEIAPTKGDPFNPNNHQAIASIPAEGQASNTVVEVFQKGYFIADRVLRPALVSVSA